MPEFKSEKMETCFPAKVFGRMARVQLGLGVAIVWIRFTSLIFDPLFATHPVMPIVFFLGISHCFLGYSGSSLAKRPITNRVAIHWITSFFPFLMTLPTMIGLAFFQDMPYSYSYSITYFPMALAFILTVMSFSICLVTLINREGAFSRQTFWKVTKFLSASHYILFWLASILQINILGGDLTRGNLVWYFVLFFTSNSLFCGCVALFAWTVLKVPNRESVGTLLVTSILALLTAFVFSVMGIMELLGYVSLSSSLLGNMVVIFLMIGVLSLLSIDKAQG